ALLVVLAFAVASTIVNIRVYVGTLSNLVPLPLTMGVATIFALFVVVGAFFTRTAFSQPRYAPLATIAFPNPKARRLAAIVVIVALAVAAIVFSLLAAGAS